MLYNNFEGDIMFKVTLERFETKANLCILWDEEDIIEQYFIENPHCEEFIFESDSYQQVKTFFDCEKADCKTYSDGIYMKADVICLYCKNELIEAFAASLH